MIAGLVFGADLIVVAAAFAAAHLLRRVWLPELGLVKAGFYPLSSYLPLLPVALLVWAGYLLTSGTYRSHRTISLPREALDLLRTSVLSGLTFVILLFFLRLDEHLLGDDRVSRAWVLLFVLMTFSGLLLEKVALRVAARAVRRRGYNYRNILVVGSGPIARSITQSIAGHRWWGYKILGFLQNGEDEVSLGLPRLGSFHDLQAVTDQYPVDEIVLTVNYLRHPELEGGLLHAQELGVIVRFAFDPFPLQAPVGRLRLGELDGIPLITWTRQSASPVQFMVKRAIDLTVAGALTLVLLPLMALVAFVVKLTSPGSVLFRQRRVGLNGRLFTLLKFRTMVAGADQDRATLTRRNEMKGPVFKMRHDPRVTGVGRWIRRFSLDELPQLWNVLVGDMSLVGPRPPIPAEVEKYDRWQKRRLSMRPGLTCLWQIEGRNEVDFDRWMELDLAYIDNWSPWLDVKILLRTIPAVLGGRGAY